MQQGRAERRTQQSRAQSSRLEVTVHSKDPKGRMLLVFNFKIYLMWNGVCSNHSKECQMQTARNQIKPFAVCNRHCMYVERGIWLIDQRHRLSLLQIEWEQRHICLDSDGFLRNVAWKVAISWPKLVFLQSASTSACLAAPSCPMTALQPPFRRFHRPYAASFQVQDLSDVKWSLLKSF